VVQPAHGSFPELIRETGGGLLVPPGDAQALPGRCTICSAMKRAAGSWAMLPQGGAVAVHR